MTEIIAVDGNGITTSNLAQNPAAVYLAGLSEGSRRTMRGALDTIAAMLGDFDALTCPWGALRFQHTSAIRAQLAARFAPATANKMLCALRGVLKTAWRLGQIDAESYQRAVDVRSVEGATLPAGRAIESGELGALFRACAADKTAAGVRDAAILGMLYACGLRRAEVVNLDLADYNEATGELKVHGKRNRQRVVHVVNGARAAISDWLNLRGRDAGPLFCPVNKGGKVSLRRITPQAVYNMLAKRAAEAGVQELSPHDLRRSFVSDLLDAGADIATVQKLAGHANVATTARYDRRPEEAKRRAAELLHIPYRSER